MENKLNLPVPTTEITKKVDTFLGAAKMLTITCDAAYESAAQMLLQEKTLLKFVEQTFEPTKKAMNEAKNELMRTIRSFTDPLDHAEGIIKKKMGEYHQKREQERLAEQRRLQEEARRKEEELRLVKAIHTGDESILDLPVEVPTVELEDTTAMKGISYREIVKYEVVEPMKVPFPEYWMIDEAKIGKVVRATNGTVVIPGVRVWKEKVVAAAPSRA